MTDLSTANLKRLLDQAAQVIYEEVNKTWERGEILTVAGEAERVANALADAGLLAPQLAQEVLRMREALHDLSEVWEAVSIDPTRTPAEQQLAAAVVDHIDQILGDHDE